MSSEVIDNISTDKEVDFISEILIDGFEIVNFSIKNKVATFKWPVSTQEVLMPKTQPNDLFQWLFISILVSKNLAKNLEIDSYRDEEIYEVKSHLSRDFGNILDKEIIDKVQNNVFKNFVSKNKLTENAIESLTTSNELFSDALQICTVYQDISTSEIVPYFDEIPKLASTKEPDELREFKNDLDILAIKKSVKLFEMFKKKEECFDEKNVDEISFLDPDMEVAFFTDDGEFLENNEMIDLRNYKEFKVVPIGERKNIYLNVDVFFDSTGFSFDTTLKGVNLRNWLKNLFLHKVNANNESFRMFIAELDELFLINDEVESDLAKVAALNESGQFKHFGRMYRFVEELCTEDMKRFVYKMDNYFETKNETIFNILGTYLEALIEPIVPKQFMDRRNWELDYFYKEVKNSCKSNNVDPNCICTRNIFNDFKRSYSGFKSNLALIVLFNPEFKTKELDINFLSNLVGLYNLRNSYSHYDKNRNKKKSEIFNQELITQIYLVTKNVTELY